MPPKVKVEKDDILKAAIEIVRDNGAGSLNARAVADLVEARFPNLNGKVEIHSIGTAIGSHTGPGTVALFFWGSTRTH